jgi:hypothetical protein
MSAAMKLGAALTACLLVAAAAEAQMRPAGTGPHQLAKYAVDGRALGSRIDSAGAMRDYKCIPSEQFNGFTWCQRTSRERERRGAFDASYSVLHAKDGTVVYLNRHQQPAFFDAAEAERDIQKYGRLFGEAAHISKMPHRSGAPEATIATWGRIELEPLDGDSVKLLAEGKSPKKGFLLDYLGNLSRSAQEGLPIFRIRGSAGFAWAASFDQKGRGTLRMVAIDASALPAEPATIPQPASPAAADAADSGEQPATVPMATAVPAVTESDAAAGGTAARLESELAQARQERAEAEEAARVARTDAEAARSEMAAARIAATAAAAEIDRQKPAAVAPSAYLDRSNAAAMATAAVAVLIIGVWLGFRLGRWWATARARSNADAHTQKVGEEALQSATKPTAAGVDQDGLVRELGKQLGLEEAPSPSLAAAPPDNNLEPVPQEEHFAPPIMAAISSEQPAPNAQASVDAAR